MQRLHLLDAQFLHLEDAAAPMHIACISIFAGPVPQAAEIEALFRSKLHQVPRYRQRVRFVPLELGRPVWIDDPRFDLGYHLRRTALPAPHDDRALCNLMGRIMSQPLDRDRPLWEAWVVEGLKGRRWALISKIHHCLVDGISGIELLAALLDTERESRLPDVVPWTPAAEPSDLALVLDAWRGLAGDAFAWARKTRDGLTHPADGVRAVVETGQGLIGFARRLLIKPPSSIVGTVGTHRVYAHASVTLDDVRTVRKGLGGTVNDVVLAAVTAGIRALLLHRGEPIGPAGIRSLVPVSVRTADARGISDNRVSALLCDLPVHLADPRERLRVLSAQMAELKGSHMVEAGEWATELGDLAPPMVVGTVTRLVTRAMHQLPQRAINTVVTNVPGPPFTLHCLGRTLLECLPYVPIIQGVRVGTAALSYDGRIAFGITGDYDSARDVDVMAAAIAVEVRALVRLARRAATAGRRRADRPAGRARSGAR